ncbi:class I SAM-dependent methyltransferase [Butyrivibrio sp. MC2013]|uniref:class I SAM-dependent methyltransferase n=1 Tax=Butyrivibrio sp. MC2013 TaxID=1280686 RepID=UPI0003FAF790|nr:class I SAM-dependent methyltransferase [Butyrivibrio sp. MC2013]
MENYIQGNKEAWEEAFDNRAESWGVDITERIPKEEYPFFEKEMADILRGIDCEDKTIGQFCCNNGRELLSLVKSGRAAKGIGFDIAENQVAFANEKAKELKLPCSFEAINIYDIDDRYDDQFDIVIITIGALCWFEDLNRFFEIVAKTMKPGALIFLNEQHPCTNMLASESDPEFDPEHRKECLFSYFDHKWIGNEGMYYITQKSYHSKTFTDFTHSMSEIISGMCNNEIVITGLQEFDYDIGGGFTALDHTNFPLSMIIEGKKLG